MENAFIKVLRIADFRNLWLSQLISQVFINLLFFSLMIRVYELTRSNSAVSLMVLLVALPNILVGAWAGVLVDRSDRKIVMFFSHFLRVFAVLAFLVSPETLSWLYILVFLASVITQFFFPAEAATIHEVVPDRKLLLTANSLFTLTFFASVIGGNVLAGIFLRSFAIRGTFLLVSLAFLLASFFTARLPGASILSWIRANLHGEFARAIWRERTGLVRSGELFSDFLAGVDHLYKNPLVRRGLYVLGISQITVGVLGTIAPGFADRILHIDVADISLDIMAPAALGMVLGAVAIGQFFRKVKRETLIRLGMMVVAGGLLIFSFIDVLSRVTALPVVLASGLVLVVLGAANAFLDVPVNTLIQEKTPEEIRSRIYGVVATVIGLAAVVPIVLAGTLADIFGVRAVMILSAVAVLIFALYTNLKLNHDTHSS